MELLVIMAAGLGSFSLGWIIRGDVEDRKRLYYGRRGLLFSCRMRIKQARKFN